MTSLTDQASRLQAEHECSQFGLGSHVDWAKNFQFRQVEGQFQVQPVADGPWYEISQPAFFLMHRAKREAAFADYR